MVDPKSTICTYEATSGSGSHIGKVNLSEYTEIDLVLDQKPVFLGHDELNLMEDTRLAFDLNEIFSDLDDLDISVASQISNLSFSDGYVTNSVENWTGTESLLFRAVDTMGNSTEGTIEFNVGPVNDLPVFDPLLPEITINEDSETYLNLSHHIKDGDGDGVNVSIGQVDGLTLDLDTAAWNLTISSDMDWFGTADIPVYLNDTHGETRGVIRLDVLPINDPPYFNIPPSWNVTVEKGKVYEVNLSGMVLDVDSEIVALNVASDHATITGRVLHILYPEGSDRTLETLTITADDGGGGTATCQLTVYIKNGSIGPKPEWELYSADVSHDRSGNWEVEAVGAAGREVYIVIEGVGSFKLEEDQEHPGFYSTVVPSNLFTAGERYRYHFTDRSGGEDLAPTLSDELIQPMVGTEEDEEEKYFLSPWAIVCCMVAFVIVLLLLVMVVMLLTMGRRGQPEE